MEYLIRIVLYTLLYIVTIVFVLNGFITKTGDINSNIFLLVGATSYSRETAKLYPDDHHDMPLWDGKRDQAPSTEINSNQHQSRVPWIKIQGTRNEYLQLDFSGRIRTHVIGPSLPFLNDSVMKIGSDETHCRSHLPVFGVDMERKWFRSILPSVFVSTNYDFSNCWYGVQRMGITFHFYTRKALLFRTLSKQLLPTGQLSDSNQQRSNNEGNALARWYTRFLIPLRPASVEVTKEFPVASTVDNDRNSGFITTTLACRWPFPRKSMFALPSQSGEKQSYKSDYVALEIRKCDNSPYKAFDRAIVSVPLHRRIHLECRLFDGNSVPGTQTLNDGPTVDGTEKDDWWVPNVRIDALGLMESTNQLWIDRESQPTGLTLSVRRPIKWSVLGWLGGGYETNHTEDSLDTDQTRIQLRIKRHFTPRRSTMFEITSFIRRPAETLHLLVRQDIAIGRSPG